MPLSSLKNELQNILSGKSQVSQGTLIQAAIRYLRRSSPTSSMAEADKQHKNEETERLKKYITESKLWLDDINFSDFISEGAEQRVFTKDEKNVYKLNDSIYYSTWVDYLHNLLLNNFFFPDTAYQLLGFS